MAFFILAGIILGQIDNTKKQKTKLQYRYIAKKDIMTNAEKQFYKKLQAVCDDDILIFPQIHLSSLFDHKIKGQNWKGAFSSINQKSVDYLLCDRNTLRPLLVIELDDNTHKRPDRIIRDKIVNEIFSSSSIFLLRVSDLNIDDKILKANIIKKVS